MIQLTTTMLLRFFSAFLVMALLAASIWVQFFPATLFFSAAVVFTPLAASFMLSGPLFLLTLLSVVLLHTAIVVGLRAYGTRKFVASLEEATLHGKRTETLQKLGILFVVVVLCFTAYNIWLLAGSLSLTALFFAGPAMVGVVAFLWGLYLTLSLWPFSAQDASILSFSLLPLSVPLMKRDAVVQDCRLKKGRNSQIKIDIRQQQKQQLQPTEDEVQPITPALDAQLIPAVAELRGVENIDGSVLKDRDFVLDVNISLRDGSQSLGGFLSQDSGEAVNPVPVAEPRQEEVKLNNVAIEVTNHFSADLASQERVASWDAMPQGLYPLDVEAQSEQNCSAHTLNEAMFLTPVKKIKRVNEGALTSALQENNADARHPTVATEPEDPSAVVFHFGKRDPRCSSFRQSPQQLTSQRMTGVQAPSSTVSSSAFASPPPLPTTPPITPVKCSSSHTQTQRKLNIAKLNASSKSRCCFFAPASLPLTFSGYECQRRHLDSRCLSSTPKGASQASFTKTSPFRPKLHNAQIKQSSPSPLALKSLVTVRG